MCSRWLAYSSRTGCGLKGFCARPQRRNASVPHALYSNNEQSHIRIQLSSSPAHTHTHKYRADCVRYIIKHTHAQMYDTICIHRHMQAHNGRHQRQNTSKLYTWAKTTGGKHTVTSWGCPNKLHNSSTRSTRLETTSVPEQHQRASHQTQPASSAALQTLT